MSRILNTHVSLWDPSGDLTVLTPGSELPEWAEGRVGDHCLVPEIESGAEDFTGSGDEGGEGQSEDTAEDPVDESDCDGEGESEADKGDDADPAAKTETPDFTAPAARRGRARKA